VLILLPSFLTPCRLTNICNRLSFHHVCQPAKPARCGCCALEQLCCESGTREPGSSRSLWRKPFSDICVQLCISSVRFKNFTKEVIVGNGITGHDSYSQDNPKQTKQELQRGKGPTWSKPCPILSCHACASSPIMRAPIMAPIITPICPVRGHSLMTLAQAPSDVNSDIRWKLAQFGWHCT
jgi:hypothetical protein